MKLLPLFLALCLLLCACTACTATAKTLNANEVAALLRSRRSLLLQCVEEMENLGEERVYAAMEDKKIPREDGTEETVSRLVHYTTESGTHTEFENEILQRTLVEMNLKLIFFQTASDSRRCVIFSYTKENDRGLQNGFYYTYDNLPCGWWGRKADLRRKDEKYLQMSPDQSAWYYTLQLEDFFYYFEKSGSLLA